MSIIGALLPALLILGAGSDNPVAGKERLLPPQERPHVIELANRTFTPEEGIDRALTEALSGSGVVPVPGLVQLRRLPTLPDRARLFEAGVQLEQYLGGTAYHARFSREAEFATVLAVIRWAGPLLIQDKIERDLWEGKIQESARTKSGKIKVLISFYSDVGGEEVERILAELAGDYRRHGVANSWATELDCESIRQLADDDRVSWIEQGPLPFIPLRR